MRILAHVAQRIVNEVTKVINEEVIVINREGYIIAASDSHRINSFHEGGKEVVRTEEKLIINEKELKRLRGVKIGLNLPIRFQQKVIGVIGITGSKTATIRHGELIQRMTELIIEEAYAAERFDSKLRGLETFVSEWLHSETMTEDLKDRGEILGIDTGVSRYCVLIQLEQEKLELIELGTELDVLRTMQTMFPHEQNNVLVRWGRGRFVLLISAERHNDDRLDQVLRQLAMIIEEKHYILLKAGCSRVHNSQMHLAYKEAKQALDIKNVRRRIIFYDTFTLELALNEIKLETKKKMTDKVLGKLYGEQDLLETLQAYFDHHLSIKETASSLHIHINTLHYRLKRIEELTGYQLKETKELVTLYIALWYYHII